MSGHSQRDNRVKVTFEVDRDVLESLRAIAHSEHRTLAAQLRVVCEDAIAGLEPEDAAA